MQYPMRRSVLTLALSCMLFSLVGCSTASTTETVPPQTTPNTPVITLGRELVPCTENVLLTSVGQSADGVMLDALMQQLDLTYKFNHLATADNLTGVKTLLMATGASAKGLGAASISAEEEADRTAKLLTACEEQDIEVILVHLGGEARRGTLSDGFIDQVLDSCDQIIVVESGNMDGKFTTYAEEHQIPITLLNRITDCSTPLISLFS